MEKTKFQPTYLIASGQTKKTEVQYGIKLWDDRDPRQAGREGVPACYIFRKSRPCRIKLGNLIIQKKGNDFFLISKGTKVAQALVNYYGKSHADIAIQTYESHRRRGFATILFGWLSDWLTDNGYIHESTCMVDNHASLKMHLKLGFEIAGHIRWSRKEHHENKK